MFFFSIDIFTLFYHQFLFLIQCFLFNYYVVVVFAFRLQDACGVVIQEALKFYQLRDERKPRSLEHNLIWDELSRDYQEILTPFLTSRYIYIHPVEEHQQPGKAEEPPVLFGEPPLCTYSDWIRTWTATMIGRITPATVTTNFFRQCTYLVHDDLSRCLVLLPYIVLYLLLHCDMKEKALLRVEMTAVLRYADSLMIFQLINQSINRSINRKLAGESFLPSFECKETLFLTIDHSEYFSHPGCSKRQYNYQKRCIFCTL